MPIFNITDVTTAGAFCNAIKAASESDRRNSQYQGVRPKMREAAPALRIDTIRYAYRALRSGLSVLRLGSFGISKSA